MTLNEYQKEALVTAVFTESELIDLSHWTLGIAGEAGEFADKIKKIIRDHEGKINETEKEELIKELGDVLWYLAVMAEHLGVDFETVAKTNIKKLRDRQKRGRIQGKGDNR